MQVHKDQISTYSHDVGVATDFYNTVQSVITRAKRAIRNYFACTQVSLVHRIARNLDCLCQMPAPRHSMTLGSVFRTIYAFDLGIPYSLGPQYIVGRWRIGYGRLWPVWRGVICREIAGMKIKMTLDTSRAGRIISITLKTR